MSRAGTDRGGGRVGIVHDFTTPGWDGPAEFAGFNDWLCQAKEDLIEFEE